MKWAGVGESSNVEDRRGMGGTGMAVGGGAGVVVLIIGLLFGVDLKPFLNQGGGPGVQQKGAKPINDETLKFSKAVFFMTEEVWTEEFRKLGKRYEKPGMVLFSERVDSEGCGVAPSEVGPFYCPRSRKVFLDPTFFDELQSKLGGSKAEFSQAYVIAHEVGHHVQNLRGYSQRADEARQQGKKAGNAASVRLELQADYLAGVWAHHGQRKFNFIEPGDVEAAITSAQAIGDDRLAKKSGRWASPESFTHGSSEARTRWFKDGLRTGDASVAKLDSFFELELRALDPAFSQ